jgi:ketosteroid isomerase-like protein
LITFTPTEIQGMNQADQNAEIVRRGYAAFNAADMKTLMELFDENASWHTPGQSPISGDHKGREAVNAMEDAWMLAAASSSSSTMAELLTGRNTITTSTPGTSSGGRHSTSLFGRLLKK